MWRSADLRPALSIECCVSCGRPPMKSTSCATIEPRWSRIRTPACTSYEASSSTSFSRCTLRSARTRLAASLREVLVSGALTATPCRPDWPSPPLPAADARRQRDACRVSATVLREMEVSVFHWFGLVRRVSRKKRALEPSCMPTMAKTSGARWRTRIAVRTVWQSAVCRSERFITGGEKMTAVRATLRPAKRRSSDSSSEPRTRVTASSSCARRGASFSSHSPSRAGLRSGMRPQSTTTWTCGVCTRICSAELTACERPPQTSTWSAGGIQSGVASRDLRRARSVSVSVSERCWWPQSHAPVPCRAQPVRGGDALE
mmetsp:Transcript_61058/g.167466  ORF Transcript_61058/g.167466 Transcript_61058/m.167466 type:complete len:317 (-) Transcript_61058:258-1208(-)